MNNGFLLSVPGSRFRSAGTSALVGEPETGNREPRTPRQPVGRGAAVACVLALGALLAVHGTASAAGRPRVPANPKFEVQPVWQNLNYPLALTFESDRRLFFIERYSGRIRLIERGVLRPDPVATLEVSGGGEQGLLGLALHPEFAATRFLYAYCTTPNPLRNRLVRLRERDGRAEDLRVILDGLPAAPLHNGGALRFGPDGKLFVGVGDADDAAAPQDPAVPSGKVLRMNPNGSIPGDNPQPGSLVYALGLPNATDFAFHPLTGRLFAAEAGADRNGEGGFLRPSGIPGGPRGNGGGLAARASEPVLSYRSAADPTSLSFYTGLRYPAAFRFNLYVGEYATGVIRRVVLRYPEYAQIEREESLIQAPGPVTDVTEGPDGYLYFSTPTGIYRILYTGK
jgi:glucose/arabinose dehydrogenase